RSWGAGAGPEETGAEEAGAGEAGARGSRLSVFTGALWGPGTTTPGAPVAGAGPVEGEGPPAGAVGAGVAPDSIRSKRTASVRTPSSAAGCNWRAHWSSSISRGECAT